MTSQPDELDSTTYVVCDIEGIAKATIRAAARDHRWPMWEAYQTAVKDAAASSVEFPWQDPEDITRITARRARDVLRAVLRSVPDLAEQKWLATVMSGEVERLEHRMASGQPDTAVPAGKYPPRHCVQCGSQYRPERPHSKYCGQSCRQAAYKDRKAARAR